MSISAVTKLNYDPEAFLFKLPCEYLADSGLSKKSCTLYCRSTFAKQFTFLQERVVKEGVIGWILGPPGTGKSTTALAFASTLDRNDIDVTWIHLSRAFTPMCVRLQGSLKKSREIENIEDLKLILNDVDASKTHLVFLDGYTTKGPRHIEFLMACNSWLIFNSKVRRLVVVCSMPCRGKINEEEDDMHRVEEFFVYSWKLTEFKEAVKHQELFSSIKDNMDPGVVEKGRDAGTEVITDLVESKFYFAGGCSRYMFRFPTMKVVEFLDRSISSVGDVMPYIKGTIGDRSDSVINRLFGLSLDDNSKNETSIVSRYAAVGLALKLGADLVRNFAKAIDNDRNPSMNGWIFEMLFFANLQDVGVTLYDGDSEKHCWGKSKVNELNVKSGVFPLFPPNTGVWLKPQNWNQGGYDAIYIDKSQSLVRFVQVTSGDAHSFKIGFFATFLETLKNSEQSFEIKTLEIVFVVEHSKFATFHLSTITGQGLLAAFGWAKTKRLTW